MSPINVPIGSTVVATANPAPDRDGNPTVLVGPGVWSVDGFPGAAVTPDADDNHKATVTLPAGKSGAATVKATYLQTAGPVDGSGVINVTMSEATAFTIDFVVAPAPPA